MTFFLTLHASILMQRSQSRIFYWRIILRKFIKFRRAQRKRSEASSHNIAKKQTISSVQNFLFRASIATKFQCIIDLFCIFPENLDLCQINERLSLHSDREMARFPCLVGALAASLALSPWGVCFFFTSDS